MLTFATENRCVVVGPRDTSRYFEKNTLTHAQVGRIIENCVKMLEDSRDYLYFGVILLVTMGITISELCALTWGSFSSSNTYTGVTVIEVVAEAKVAGEVYRTEELNGPRRQALPLSPMVARLHINKEYHA
jgi:integrase